MRDVILVAIAVILVIMIIWHSGKTERLASQASARIPSAAAGVTATANSNGASTGAPSQAESRTQERKRIRKAPCTPYTALVLLSGTWKLADGNTYTFTGTSGSFSNTHPEIIGEAGVSDALAVERIKKYLNYNNTGVVKLDSVARELLGVKRSYISVKQLNNKAATIYLNQTNGTAPIKYKMLNCKEYDGKYKIMLHKSGRDPNYNITVMNNGSVDELWVTGRNGTTLVATQPARLMDFSVPSPQAPVAPITPAANGVVVANGSTPTANGSTSTANEVVVI